VNPGGGSGWDEPPLDIQIPDDARELDRDVIAYHRELRARRRRRRLRRLTAPFSGRGTVMPLLASILAVCLVAGAMLSVATFSPATGPEQRGQPSATAASGVPSAAQRSSDPDLSDPDLSDPERTELQLSGLHHRDLGHGQPVGGRQGDRPSFGLGELLGPVRPAGERDQPPASARGPVTPARTPRHRPAA
jgi:hypothetical protein